MSIRPNKSLLHYLTNNTKYRVLIRSLIGLFVWLLIVIFINLFMARSATISTEHMDIIGNISDLTLEIATGAQQLAIVDASDVESNQRITSRLQNQAKALDEYLAKLPNYAQKEHAMDDFALIWQEYRKKISMLSGNSAEDRLNLAWYAYEQQAHIWDLMNIGYDTYLNETYRWAQYSRYLQLVTLASLIIYLLFFINYTFRQLRDNDLAIEKAHGETADIMNTVNEGLFLIDKDLVIGDNYSKKLEQILHRKDIAGLKLPQLLSSIVSRQQIEETKRFVEHLYQSWIAEELIKDSNPLQEVEVTYVDENGITETRFLNFEFLRVVDPKAENQEAVKVFVSVFDITNETQLKLQMQQDQSLYRQQLAMTSQLLTLDKENLRNFIQQNRIILERMKRILKTEAPDKMAAVHKAQQLLNETYELDKLALSLNISKLQKIAKELEETLRVLLKSANLKDQDFSEFLILLNRQSDMMDFIESLSNGTNLPQ